MKNPVKVRALPAAQKFINMPCIHKFHQYLNLNNLDFEPTTLIIGTFNPGWDTLNNNAEWFYGRTGNNYFWDVLPRIYEDVNLRNGNQADWKLFCARNKIAITDLIASIDDADQENQLHINAISNYKDSDIASFFQQFTHVNIINILENYPTITNVYFTRQSGNDFWDNLWNEVAEELNNRNINFQTLLTPSANARYQMRGSPGLSLRDFIFNNWQSVWHQLI